MSNLGNLHYVQGKDKKKMFCRALEGFEQEYGPTIHQHSNWLAIWGCFVLELCDIPVEVLVGSRIIQSLAKLASPQT